MNITRFNKMHFGLFDKKGNIFVDYIWSTSFSDIHRHFHYLVNQKNTILNLYAKDFCVYLLGSIDDETGEYDSVDKVLLHECINLIDKSTDDEPEMKCMPVESEDSHEVSH